MLFVATLESFADYVTTTDGRRIEGVVVSENRKEVKLRTMVSNVETVLTFSQKDVYSIIIHPVPDDFFEVKKRNPTPAEISDKADDQIYLLIPINGEIGVDVLNDGIIECLEYAKRQSIAKIVFDIDTPGGQVGESLLIAKTLDQYKSDFTYISIVKNALSAGIWFVASSNEVYVSERSLIGAAVVVDSNPTQISPELAKSRSFVSATIESIAESNGFNPIVFRAMQIQDQVLYAFLNPETNVVELHDHVPERKKDWQYELIDSEQTILTLTGKTAVTLGIGKYLPESGYSGQAKGDVGSRLMDRAAKDKKALQERQMAEVALSEKIEETKKAQEEAKKAQIERDLARYGVWLDQIERMILRAKENDPRIFSDYEIEIRTGTSLEVKSVPGSAVVEIRTVSNGVSTVRLSANGLRLWRQRTDSNIKEWRDILAGIADIAELLSKYEGTTFFDLSRVRVEDVHCTANDEIARLQREK